MKALIVGCTGQDGSYLSEQLTNRGIEVFGVSQGGLHTPDGSIDSTFTIDNQAAVNRLIVELRPEKIFYLAAYHHSAEDIMAKTGEIMRHSLNVHVYGLLTLLEVLLAQHPTSRLFYAASSHVFGAPTHAPQDETTPMNAICPYGISKTAGVQLCRLYRNKHNIFCSVGFLYNHESPRRQNKFLSRKIVQAAVAIERQISHELVLGNLDALVDWGFAPEYTDAMIRILEHDQSDDFIIASGTLSSVQDFVVAVFNHIGLDWQKYVRINPLLLQKTHKAGNLTGNYSKLNKATGWQPITNLVRLAGIMVEAEHNRT